MPIASGCPGSGPIGTPAARESAQTPMRAALAGGAGQRQPAPWTDHQPDRQAGLGQRDADEEDPERQELVQVLRNDGGVDRGGPERDHRCRVEASHDR
jgi:hypothetical protein